MRTPPERTRGDRGSRTRDGRTRLLPIPDGAVLGETADVMEPVEGTTPRSALQAAKEPLSLRFLLAFSASTVLTGAVAVPMAVQAHIAREDQGSSELEVPMVLGTTTVPQADPSDLPPDGLFVRLPGSDERALLDGAELSGQFELNLELPDVVRVDFVLDDGDVITDRAEPWAPFPGEGDDTEPSPPEPISAGEHILTAAVTFTDGRIELRRANFTVVPS